MSPERRVAREARISQEAMQKRRSRRRPIAGRIMRGNQGPALATDEEFAPVAGPTPAPNRD
jgi:hypothetical protein